jgi:hypothetical protein
LDFRPQFTLRRVQREFATSEEAQRGLLFVVEVDLAGANHAQMAGREILGREFLAAIRPPLASRR